MAYSFQTFSIGQILTAAQMNQVEASIRDHQHGVAGVSGSGMTFASPVFTTQISTPKVVTVSVDLELTPSGNNDIILHGSGTGKTGVRTTTPENILDFGTIPTGDGIRLGQIDTGLGTTHKYIGLNDLGSPGTFPSGCWMSIDGDNTGNYGLTLQTVEAGIANYTITFLYNGNVGLRNTTVPTARLHFPISAAGAAGTAPCKFTLASTVVLGTPEAGVLEPDSSGNLYFTNSAAARKTIAFTDGSVATVTTASQPNITTAANLTTIGTLVAGTVPLARMMRTEVQGGTTSVDYVVLDMGTVVAGDRIFCVAPSTVALSSIGSLGIICAKVAGTATVDFAGTTNSKASFYSATNDVNGTLTSIIRVSVGGTLTLRIDISSNSGINSRTVYAHAIVLNNG